ncbi:unnamed protein product, partial [Urochloa humidicola]
GVDDAAAEARGCGGVGGGVRRGGASRGGGRWQAPPEGADGAPGAGPPGAGPALSYPSSISGRDRAVVVNLDGVRAVITAAEVLIPAPRDPAVAPLVA